MWDPSQKSQILPLNYIIKYYGNWCLILSFWVFQFLFLKKGKEKRNILEVSRTQRRLQRRSMEKGEELLAIYQQPLRHERMLSHVRRKVHVGAGVGPIFWHQKRDTSRDSRAETPKMGFGHFKEKKQYNWFLWRSGNKWINKI